MPTIGDLLGAEEPAKKRTVGDLLGASQKAPSQSAATIAAGANVAGQQLQPIPPTVEAIQDLTITPLVSAPFALAGTAAGTAMGGPVGGVAGEMAGQIAGGMAADWLRDKVNQSLYNAEPHFPEHKKESFINNLVGTVLGETIFRGVPAGFNAMRGKGQYQALAREAEQQAQAVAQKAIGEESAAQLEARGKQFADVQEIQQKVLTGEEKAARELPAQLEKIRTQALEEVQKPLAEETIGRETGHTRAAAEAERGAWFAPTPSGVVMPTEAKTTAVKQGRDALFEPYHRAMKEAQGEYAKVIATHGETPVDPSPLAAAVANEMQYSDTSGKTFSPSVQKMFGRVQELVGGVTEKDLAQYPPQVRQAILAQAKPPAQTTAQKVFTLKSDIGEMMRGGGLSGTDKAALFHLDQAADGILEPALPISPKAREQYRLMKTYYDRAFTRGVGEATNGAMGARVLLDNPERAEQLIGNMTPEERGVARKAIAELYYDSPEAVLKDKYIPVYEQLFGKTSPLAKRGVLAYTDGKLTAVGELLDKSPATRAKFEGIIAEEMNKVHEKLANTAVEDVKNWIGKLPPQQGNQLKRELAALPDNRARARHLVAFFSGGEEAPLQAVTELAGQQRPPEGAAMEALAQQFPGGKTPLTGREVPPATTVTQAATQAVQMGLPEKRQPHFMQYAIKMAPVYGMLATLNALAGSPLGFAGHMLELGAAAGATIETDKILRRTLAKKLEAPQEALDLVMAARNPGEINNLKVIGRAVASSALKAGADRWMGSHQMMPPPAPPQAPLPDTERKERRDTAKDWRTEVHEGTEGPDITPDLNAGRATLEDARALLVPVTP